jgi:hypothetical protein
MLSRYAWACALLVVATACGGASAERPAQTPTPTPTPSAVTEAKVSTVADPECCVRAHVRRAPAPAVVRRTQWAGRRGSFCPQSNTTATARRCESPNDGAVCVGLPYEIARLDPSDGKVRSVPLAERVPDAPAALDPRNPMPGTWVSDLEVDGDTVLVARLNVPYLTRVDADLDLSRDITVPAKYAEDRFLASDLRSRRWPVDYDRRAGVLTRFTPGQPTQVLRLERKKGMAVGGNGRTVTMVERVNDLVRADDGTVWFLRDGGRVLAKWPG